MDDQADQSKASITMRADSEVLVRAEGVGKKFCRDLKKSLWYGIQDIGSELIPRKDNIKRRALLRQEEFWAVDEVSFELRRGECLGLIGRNGAGKTTLLKMLNGLIKPDKGRIEMRGRVGAMIALGAGFNPILTGRENIYVNAAVLGLSKKETDARLEEIVEFAELGEFIDAPVRSYSSGMGVRLGFAISTTLNPDVLLLDEVLAVGDAAFRAKCYHRVAELKREAAVIFVTHSMEQLARISSRALVLHRGQVAHAGDVEDGVQVYEQLNHTTLHYENEAFLSLHPPITRFNANFQTAEVNSGDSLEVEWTVVSESAMQNFLIKVLFYNMRGAFAADGSIASADAGIVLVPGENRFRIAIDSLTLKNGVYAAAFNLLDEIGDLVIWSYKMHRIQVCGAYVGGIADCHLRLLKK